MTKTSKKLLCLLLSLVLILSVFTVVPLSVGAADASDTLTASDFAATSTAYKAFSGVTKSSGAVYAGNTAYNNGAIQLRSNGSSSGIVTTTSGGTVASVKITVDHGSNTINVYGSNSPYAAATDLYNNSKQGTLIGSVTATGTVTFADSYAYVGIRSNSGAIYLNAVEIVWSGGTVEPPTEPPTDPPTEPPTDPPTEAPTQASTQPVTPSGSVTDTLNREKTGVANGATSYSNWSGKTDASGAVYAGNSAGGNNAIQLRSTNPSGIVTTASGGKATTVTVAWNSNTVAARKVDIYGKNTAYGSAADLYDNAKKGELLGSLEFNKDTELTITGDYAYLGLRSNSGALYLDEISITWSQDVAPTQAPTQAPTTAPAPAGADDVLNRALTGVTGGTYTDWSDKSVTNGSGAVYAGNSAGGNSSIQLRSTNHSGIVSTTSGGRLSKITVTWNSNTTNDRVLQIYGKNTPYESPADLYDADTQGTLLGTIIKGTNQSTELTVSGNYTYLGLRSASGAMWLTDVTITWLPGDSFTVTFKDGDTVLESKEVAIGAHPVYTGETDPADKPADAQYTYTFLGWTDGENDYGIDEELPEITDRSVVYTARYDTAVNEYRVTWKMDDSNDPLYEDDVPYGEMPVYGGYPPTKTDPNDEYYYDFSGWESSLDGQIYFDYHYPTVTQAVTYTARFTATPKPYCTVTWKDWDGSVLRTDNKVLTGTNPVYGSDDPERDDTEYYSYCFIGWATGENNISRYYVGLNLPVVNADTTFTALYSATPKYRSGRIIRTDNGAALNIASSYYLDGSTPTVQQFEEDAAFSEGEGTITLGSLTIAFTEPQDGTFAHTVYVTGEGTEDRPYVFYPNFIYSSEAEEPYQSAPTDKRDVHPGDGFKGMSRLRVGYDKVRFLQYTDHEDLDCTDNINSGYVSIFDTTYGNYEASYPFIEEAQTLYYLGELGGAHNFTEYPEIDTELGNVTPVYTVTWVNEETVLDTNTVYEGMSPVYTSAEDAVPEKPDDDYTYTFIGWKNSQAEEEVIDKDDPLPPVYGDVTYVAVYNAVLIPTYTVTWKNASVTLKTDENVKVGTTPRYDGDTPTKESTDQIVYIFTGWTDGTDTYSEFDELPDVTDDVTYTAVFGEYTPAGYDPIPDIEWVFRTNDNVAYDLEHMYYTYNGSEPQLFDGFSAFRKNGDKLLLGGKIVADIGVPLTEHNQKEKADVWHSEFANSVFVTGTGSYYQPFEFHPNYLFYGTQSTINQGFHVALKEKYIKSVNVNNLSYPGDQFKGCALIAVGGNGEGIQDVYYISKDVTEAGNYPNDHSWYVGVGLDGYGKNYQKADELDNQFATGHEILYYIGEADNVFLFDEVEPTYQISFGTPTTYNVSWLNDDGSELETSEYYYGDTPEYPGDEDPERSEEALAYNFTGWTPEIGTVTGDAEYTALYEHKDLFTGHSLTLKGDIGIYFYIDVNAANLTPADIQSGDYSIDFTFSWSTSHSPKTDVSAYNITLDKDSYDSLYDSSSKCFKIMCDTAVAEMTCSVHAEAVVKSSSGEQTYTENDDYSVREYAEYIINAPDGEFEKQDALRELAAAMLDYGAKAQTVFKVNTGDLATNNINYTTQNVTPQMIDAAIAAAPDNYGKTIKAMTADNDKFGLKYYGSTVVFLTKTTLRHYYTVTDQDLYDSCKNNTTFTLDERKKPYMLFETSDIAAKHLDTLQEFTIKGQTYYYSVLNYSKDVLNSSNMSPANKELAKATYWYNQKANGYFD